MANYLNKEDVLAQLRAAGLLIKGELVVLAQGKKRSTRCLVDGEDGQKRGWYRLYELVTQQGEYFLIGSYGVYQGDDSGARKIELTKRCEHCGYEMALRERQCPSCKHTVFKRRELSEEEREAIKKRQAEDRKRVQAERNAEIERAAKWARAVWYASVPAEQGGHDYLTRKHLASPGGTRIFPGVDGIMLEGAEDDDYRYLARFAGTLTLPMCDTAGRIFALQFILSREKHQDWIQRRDGRDKEYWPRGMSKDGHFWMLGTPGAVILTAEGFATAQTLHDETGHAVAVTFDAGNQPKVAQVLRKHYRSARILACADDDWLQKCRECKGWTPVAQEACCHCGKPHGKQNAGIARAREAAMLVDGAWIAPAFAVERPSDRKGPTDFNDLAALEGAQAVRGQIEAKLAELGIAPAASPPAPAAARRAGDPTEGGGGYEPPPAMSVMSLDALVERFVPIDDGTGAYVFDAWTRKIVLVKQMIALLPAGTRAEDIKRHPLWLSRGAYYLDQVGFDPGGTDAAVKLNTWRGWPLTPRRGSCELLIQTLWLLCSKEEYGAGTTRKEASGKLIDVSGKSAADEVVHWILCWMAYPLQHPGAKMSSAVIMHGPQGTGKSTIFQTLAKIYGDYATVLNQRGLEDKFNADWVDNKLFVLAEEVVTRQDMWHIKNELKELVTGEWIRVNPKNVTAYRQRNHLNLCYLSNEGLPLPIDEDDRRHLVVYTPPAVGEEFYDELYLELENGGVEAFYDYLLSYDTTGFHPKKRPPLTKSKERLVDLSQTSEKRFVAEWRAGELPWPFVPCLSTDLYRAYATWCRERGVRNPREFNQFIGEVKRIQGWEKDRGYVFESVDYIGKPKQLRLVIPDLRSLAEAGCSKPDDKTAAQWLTNCRFKFANSLETR